MFVKSLVVAGAAPTVEGVERVLGEGLARPPAAPPDVVGVANSGVALPDEDDEETPVLLIGEGEVLRLELSFLNIDFKPFIFG